MVRRSPHNKERPSGLGSNRTGAKKIVAPSIAAPRDRGKIQTPDPAPLAIWPKPDHPFFNQLRIDPTYVWNRMLASVSAAESLTRI